MAAKRSPSKFSSKSDLKKSAKPKDRNQGDELLNALVMYKNYLETGERCRTMQFRTFSDPPHGVSYSPIKEVECIRINGCDAVAHLRKLREKLRRVADKACNVKHLGHVVDALAEGFLFMSAGPDETVNRNTIQLVDARTKKQRPSTEYVRADALDVFERAAKRLYAMIGKKSTLSGRKAPIRVDGKSLPKVIWVSAVKATEFANRLAEVNRNWPSTWRGFCIKHRVEMRDGRKLDGTSTRSRRDVNLFSLTAAIVRHTEEFEKMTPDQEKRRAAIMEKLRQDNTFTKEELEALQDSD